jgi:hypothetical protein
MVNGKNNFLLKHPAPLNHSHLQRENAVQFLFCLSVIHRARTVLDLELSSNNLKIWLKGLDPIKKSIRKILSAEKLLV